MREYVKHYKYLVGPHCNWRDFEIHLISNCYISEANDLIHSIMHILLGYGVEGFSQTKTKFSKCSRGFDDGIDRWNVRNIFTTNSPMKYPKHQTWGTYINNIIEPVDWKLRNHILTESE